MADHESPEPAPLMFTAEIVPKFATVCNPTRPPISVMLTEVLKSVSCQAVKGLEGRGEGWGRGRNQMKQHACGNSVASLKTAKTVDCRQDTGVQ